jgi:ribosomal protein L10
MATNIWEAHSPSTFRKKLHPENGNSMVIRNKLILISLPQTEKHLFDKQVILETIYLDLNEAITK